MKKILLGISLVLIANISFSAAYSVNSKKIVKLYTYTDYAVVTLSSLAPNSESCTHAKANRHVLIDLSSNQNKAMYSSALTAFTTKGLINVGLSGCQNWGSATIPKAYRVELY